MSLACRRSHLEQPATGNAEWVGGFRQAAADMADGRPGLLAITVQRKQRNGTYQPLTTYYHVSKAESGWLLRKEDGTFYRVSGNFLSCDCDDPRSFSGRCKHCGACKNALVKIGLVKEVVS